MTALEIICRALFVFACLCLCIGGKIAWDHHRTGKEYDHDRE